MILSKYLKKNGVTLEKRVDELERKMSCILGHFSDKGYKVILADPDFINGGWYELKRLEKEDDE